MKSWISTSLLFGAACAVPLAPPPAAFAVDGASFRGDYAWTWAHCAQAVVSTPRVAFHELAWFAVPVERPDRGFVVAGQPVWGWYHRHEHMIFLAEWVVRESTVTARGVRVHELLHAQTGIDGHPPVFATCRAAVYQEDGP